MEFNARSAENAYRLWHAQNYCGVCLGSGISLPDRPDVYFKGPYFDPNISDPDVPGHEYGSYIESRRHKAILMKTFKLQEAGDARHGTTGFDHIAHRHAMESLRRKS